MHPYTLIRSRRKTIAIHITKDATVEVRAPLKTPINRVETFVAVKDAWITRQLAERQWQNEAQPRIDEMLRQIDKTAALKLLQARVEHYAALMNVWPSAVKLSSAKTRWGSCSAKNSLNFSLRLFLAEDELIDYVVVHELAHIREHNHSPCFWAIVESVLPDYRERRMRLNKFRS